MPFYKLYNIYSLSLVLLEIVKLRPLKEIFPQSMREGYFTKLGADYNILDQDEL